MKKITLIIIALATSFCFGFAFKSIITNNINDNIKIKRVTSIGGIFFKCKDPGKMKEWYKKHLNFNVDDWGSTFWWKDNNGKPACTQWSPFKSDTVYFFCHRISKSTIRGR